MALNLNALTEQVVSDFLQRGGSQHGSLDRGSNAT